MASVMTEAAHRRGGLPSVVSSLRLVDLARRIRIGGWPQVPQPEVLPGLAKACLRLVAVPLVGSGRGKREKSSA
jgi:hypothetical protein